MVRYGENVQLSGEKQIHTQNQRMVCNGF